MQKLMLFLCFMVAYAQTGAAQEYNEVAFFDFSENMRKAHEHAIRMRLKDCKLMLQTEKSRNPYNLMPYYLDNIADFFYFYANENHAEFKRAIPQRDVRLAKMRIGDNGSPYYLYTQAAIQLQWAMLHIKYDEYAEAAKLLKKGLSDIEKNMKTFPDFMGNKKVQGAINALSGALSNDLKSGLSGNIYEGLQQIATAIDYGKKYPRFEFNEETQLWYGLVMIELGIEEASTWAVMNASLLDSKKSKSAAYILAMMQIETGSSSRALATIEGSPQDENYHPFHYMEFLRGLCYLYKLDVKCETYFKNYLFKYVGVHHIKDSYQKLAWAALLKGNAQGYKQNMSDLRAKGNTVAPYDANAEREALLNLSPNLNLIKAHLLFEGGYYDKALQEINQCPVASLKTDYEKAEHTFYKGRIEHKMKRLDNAAREYDAVIAAYKSKSFYFACAASFFAGQIWEERKEYDKARNYYTECAKYNPEVFKKTLHDRARTCLEAIKNLKNAPNSVPRTGTVIGPR